jgi:WD40 repeat protein
MCQGHRGEVNSVAFSPDGTVLASGSDDNTVIQWSTQTGQELRRVQGANSDVTCVAFTAPDGRRLVAGGADAQVTLWEANSGWHLHMLGHRDDVRSVACSPDGALLASGSNDTTVNVWDAQTGALLRTLAGHTAEVSSIAFSPGGRVLASASQDGTVKLWDATSGMLLATLWRVVPHEAARAAAEEWLTWTPEGYYECSAGAEQCIRFRDDKGAIVPAAEHSRTFCNPRAIQAALR